MFKNPAAQKYPNASVLVLFYDFDRGQVEVFYHISG